MMRNQFFVPGLALVLGVLAVSGSAGAHHILGIPHYAYDEDYPQAPVLTYRAEARGYEVKVTGYPGVLEPGDRSTIHVYIRDLRVDALLDTTVRLTVRRDALFGADPIIYGPMDAQLDEAVYKFHPRFELEANYLASVEFATAEEPWTVDVPLVVGEPGSPWTVLGTAGGALILFLVVVRAVRVKRRRRLGMVVAGPAGAGA